MCERFVKLSHDLKEPFLLLVLTGGEDMMEMTAVLDAGVDDVIGKSRDMKIIKARLMKLIQRTGTDRQ
jgi:DNA-binding response OmpR family regulator